MLLVQAERGAEAEPAVFRPPAILLASLDLPGVPEDENSASGAEATEPASPPADMAGPAASVGAMPAAERSEAPDNASAAQDDVPDSLPGAAETEAPAAGTPGDQAVGDEAAGDEAAAVESPCGLGGDALPAGVPLAAPSDGSNAPSGASDATPTDRRPRRHLRSRRLRPSPGATKRTTRSASSSRVANGKLPADGSHCRRTTTRPKRNLSANPGDRAGRSCRARPSRTHPLRLPRAGAAQRAGNTAEAALLDKLALKPVADDDEPDRGTARAAPEAGVPDTGASLAASAGAAVPPPRAAPGPASGAPPFPSR